MSSAPTPSTAVVSQPSATSAQLTLPNPNVLLQASKLAIQQDKPIQLDYYQDTAAEKAFVGEDKETKERMLVKSGDEFTSLIQNTYKVGDDYIMITENSIYIVSGKIQKRYIQANQLHQE